MIILLFLLCIVILLVSTTWIIYLYKQINYKQTLLDSANIVIKFERKPSFDVTIYAILNEENEIKYRIKDNWMGNAHWKQAINDSPCKYLLLNKIDIFKEFDTILEAEDYLSKLILNKFTEINKDVNVKTIQF